MDIISYGAASKVSKEEKHTRSDVLGEGVTSSFSTVEERIDNIGEKIGNVTKQADNLIIQNAVNIMKSHAKLNAIAQTKKYEMHNMIFDDLLDLSGIDIENSRNYSHDPVLGVITANSDCVIQTKPETTESPASKAMLIADEGVTGDSVVPPLTSNNQDGFEVIASSVFGGNYEGFQAFDGWKTTEGSGQNRWASKSGGLPAWLKIKLPSKVYLKSYAISSNPYSADSQQMNQNIKSWKFQGSNDDSNWVDLDEVAELDAWEFQETKEFNITNPGAYMYYRIYITKTFGSNIACIGEIELFQSKTGNVSHYSISCDSGESWEEIFPNILFNFQQRQNKLSDNVQLKIEIPEGVELLNYALTWT